MRLGKVALHGFFVLAAVLGLLVISVLAPRTAWAKGRSLGDPARIEVPGGNDAFYYKPRGKGPRPVVMYLHGRGGNPQEDCRKWARVASEFGWVICPQGPEDRGGGARAWANGAGGVGEKIIETTLAAMRAKFGSRVQRRGHILVGFSEGAFMAQQVGLHDQATWNKWLILAASDHYWNGNTAAALKPGKGHLRRVFLLTGENDGVAQNTMRVGDTLRKAKVPVKVRLVPGMGHEVPEDRMVSLYRRPLAWLAAAK